MAVVTKNLEKLSSAANAKNGTTNFVKKFKQKFSKHLLISGLVDCVLTHNHSGLILSCVLSENVLLVTVIVYTQYIHRSHNQYHHVHVYYNL